jgi:hypothetical protein
VIRREVPYPQVPSDFENPPLNLTRVFNVENKRQNALQGSESENPPNTKPKEFKQHDPDNVRKGKQFVFVKINGSDVKLVVIVVFRESQRTQNPIPTLTKNKIRTSNTKKAQITTRKQTLKIKYQRPAKRSRKRK